MERGLPSLPIGVARPQYGGRWDTGSCRFLAMSHFLEPGVYRRPRRDPFQFAAAELLHGLTLKRGSSGKLVADLLGDALYRDLCRHGGTMTVLAA